MSPLIAFINRFTIDSLYNKNGGEFEKQIKNV